MQRMKGEDSVARRRGMMSDRLKEEIAKELGFYEVVEKEGWGGIRAKDAGNLVKRAVEIAQAQLTNKN
jgi:small acid-soluble spore protein F (minor alpha/beta-type SASP)